MTLFFFKWEQDRWLKSQKRTSLSLAARAIFLELLFRNCSEGSLPTDHDALARISLSTPAEFRRAWPCIKDAFPEKNGRLQNDNATAIYLAAVKKSKKAEESAGSRWGNDANAYANACANASQTHDDPVCERICYSDANADASHKPQATSHKKPSAAAKLAELLSEVGWKAAAASINRLADRCQAAAPDATADEVAHFVGLTAGTVRASAKDRMAVLISEAPSALADGLAEYRAGAAEREQKAEKLRQFNRIQRVKTLREIAASDGTEKWAVEARENAIRELRELGEEVA
jgi:uncharacterized protein YdaU (DUF1376 family)